MDILASATQRAAMPSPHPGGALLYASTLVGGSFALALGRTNRRVKCASRKAQLFLAACQRLLLAPPAFRRVRARARSSRSGRRSGSARLEICIGRFATGREKRRRSAPPLGAPRRSPSPRTCPVHLAGWCRQEQPQ